VFLEANLVGVVRVRFVAVDGLGAVRVLDGGVLLLLLLGFHVVLLLLRRRVVVGHAAELGRGRVAALGAGGAAGVPGDGGRGLEAVELRGCVHLRRLVVDLSFGPDGVAVGDGARGARARVLFVQGVRVDKGAVGGLRLGAVVEDPYNLSVLGAEAAGVRAGADLRRSWRGGCSRQRRPRRTGSASRRAS
jgi:hypothetical protein